MTRLREALERARSAADQSAEVGGGVTLPPSDTAVKATWQFDADETPPPLPRAEADGADLALHERVAESSDAAADPLLTLTSAPIGSVRPIAVFATSWPRAVCG